MNEYDRLYRQAQRYREMYPEGTRILLLHMGDDPRPVEDNMRGTVITVDDMSAIHCKFDNGRQLGIIPGEDSFRKLTDEELAEEQADSEDMDEDNGPVIERASLYTGCLCLSRPAVYAFALLQDPLFQDF